MDRTASVGNNWFAGRIPITNPVCSLLPDKPDTNYISVKQEVDLFEDNLENVVLGAGYKQRLTRQKNNENSEQPSSSKIQSVSRTRQSSDITDRNQVQKNKTYDSSIGTAKRINCRGQVDVIDMRTEQVADHKFIFAYEEQISEFIVLKPLRSDAIAEVTAELFDVLAILGAPQVLQSGNGRDFAELIVRELRASWTDLKMVHGELIKIGRSSVKRDFRKLVRSWLAMNPGKTWCEGLRFVQMLENTSLRYSSDKSPYDLLFGRHSHEEHRTSVLSGETMSRVWSEEDWDKVLDDQKKNTLVVNLAPSTKQTGNDWDEKEARSGSACGIEENHNVKEDDSDTTGIEFDGDLDRSPMSQSDSNGFKFVNVKNETSPSATQMYDSQSENEANSTEKLKGTKRRKYQLKCKICQKQYMKLGHLKNHMMSHTKVTSFDCKHCSQKFHLLNLYQKHMRLIHKQNESLDVTLGHAEDSESDSTHKTPKAAKNLDSTTEDPSKQICSRAKLTEKRHISPLPKEGGIKAVRRLGAIARGKLSRENRSTKLNGEPLLECNYCHQKFDFPSVLKRHVRSHTNERPYVCQVCSKSFKQLGHLSQHSLTHTDYRSFQCNVCNIKFESLDALKLHTQLHRGDAAVYRPKEVYRLFECDCCKKVFTTKSVLERHILTHTHERQFECTVCGKRFKQAGHVKSHMLVHTGERRFECTVCSKRFSLSNSLKKHMYVHNGEKPFQCDVCGARFLEKRNLNGHLMTHTNERPFACNICGKRYTLADTLRRHISAAHEDGRTYQCEICAKMFKQLAHLYVHKKVHNDERPFQCHLCDKNFKHKNVLKSHLAIHANLRPFECDVCKATFVRKTNLQTHIASAHMNERPYACTICEKRFKQVSHLNGHVVVHSNSMPYQCDFCDRRCNRLDNLKKHMRLHTKNKE